MHGHVTRLRFFVCQVHIRGVPTVRLKSLRLKTLRLKTFRLNDTSSKRQFVETTLRLNDTSSKDTSSKVTSSKRHFVETTFRLNDTSSKKLKFFDNKISST